MSQHPQYPSSGPVPPGAAFAPPRKHSRKGLFIALGVVGALLLVVCLGGGGVAAYFWLGFDREDRFEYPQSYEASAPAAEGGGEFPRQADVCSLIDMDRIDSLISVSGDPSSDSRQDLDDHGRENCVVNLSNEDEYVEFEVGHIRVEYRAYDDPGRAAENYDAVVDAQEGSLLQTETIGDAVTVAQNDAGATLVDLWSLNGNLVLEVTVRFDRGPVDVMQAVALDTANEVMNNARR